MRLLTTLLWLIAALLWLPWALLALRLVVDLALYAVPGMAHLGHPWGASPFAAPVLDALVLNYKLPQWQGWTPTGGSYFTARIGSMYPWAALAGCGLTALGWRLYWLSEEGRLPHKPWPILLTTLVPPLAPWLMLGDARQRYLAAEEDLAAARADAWRRLQRG